MTRRDLQGEAKGWAAMGYWQPSIKPRPWVFAIAQTGNMESGRIWLEVNGKVRQEGD